MTSTNFVIFQHLVVFTCFITFVTFMNVICAFCVVFMETVPVSANIESVALSLCCITVIPTATHTLFVDSTPADCSSLQNSGRQSAILGCCT